MARKAKPKGATEEQRANEEAEEKRALALALHRDGHPLRAIAASTGLSPIRTDEVLRQGLEAYMVSVAYIPEYARAVESLRLERCMEVGFKLLDAGGTTPGLRASLIGQIAKLSAQRSRLLGLELEAKGQRDDGLNDTLDAAVDAEMVPKVVT